MKICFFGLGSIGKRHLDNLIKVLNKKNINYEIHAFRVVNKEVSEDLKSNINKFITNEKDLSDDYDIVFVTNPTSLHYETIKLMKDKTKHMFIEKPIFNNLDYQLNSLNVNKNGIYYVARPLIHSNVIRELKLIIENEKIYSVRAIASSYLPNWRPNIDYRNVYSSKKELGGGVSIDLIHEWDYITYLFGFPKKIFNLQGKFSHLEIDSEDLAIYIAEYDDKLIELHLDYFGREVLRYVEILTYNGRIKADFINKKISFSDEREDIKLNRLDDMYINEMIYFIDSVLHKKDGENNIARAYNVLKLAMGVK